MAKESIQNGWVMVTNDDDEFVLAWSFCGLRRDCIQQIQDMFPKMTRRAILRQWKPMKAVRRITIER